MTLFEVVISLALVALLSGGLYAVGMKARQFAEHNRLANEARSLAKEQLEFMIAYGATQLAQSPTDVRSDTNFSTLGYPIVRRPTLVWRAADGSVTGSTGAAYVEARVDVTYQSPLIRNPIMDSFSTIIDK